MRRGFTLIELLIVVAIIAILATISVVNFLEAQARSKVSRARTDLRSFATAVETYATDHNRYVDTFGTIKLTTPIAYMSTQVRDVFAEKTGYPYMGYIESMQMSTPDELSNWDVSTYTPAQQSTMASHGWMMWSNGPDNISTALEDRQISFNDVVAAPGATFGLFYDPTNGTVSRGDVVRTPKYTK